MSTPPATGKPGASKHSVERTGGCAGERASTFVTVGCLRRHGLLGVCRSSGASPAVNAHLVRFLYAWHRQEPFGVTRGHPAHAYPMVKRATKPAQRARSSVGPRLPGACAAAATRASARTAVEPAGPDRGRETGWRFEDFPAAPLDVLIGHARRGLTVDATRIARPRPAPAPQVGDARWLPRQPVPAHRSSRDRMELDGSSMTLYLRREIDFRWRQRCRAGSSSRVPWSR